MRYEINLEQLPGHDATSLMRLIDQAEFFNLPENLIVRFNPDEYQYTISVDLGSICHTVRANDSTVPASLRPLIDELSSLKTLAG